MSLSTLCGMVPWWDWVNGHHAFVATCLVLFVGLAVTVIWLWIRRGSIRHAILWSIAPLVLVAATGATWILADQRSNARDIDGRIYDVAAVLPPSARLTASSSGDNFRTNSYLVDGEVAVAAAEVRRAAQARLSRTGRVFVRPTLAGLPQPLDISFVGRNGCDGSVDVSISFGATSNSTTVTVSGHCED